MSIRNRTSAAITPHVTGTLVVVTDEDGAKDESWEIYCDDCDFFLCGLTEDEAFTEAEAHEVDHLGEVVQ